MSKFDALRTFKAESAAPGHQRQAVAQATLQQPIQPSFQTSERTNFQTDARPPSHVDAQAHDRQYGQTTPPKVRPVGKRSDPDFKMFSHLMRKDTQRKAAMKLLRLDDGRDMSEILEALLSTWTDKPDEQS